MNEEEKKIKEMEEFGVRLVDGPKEALAKASPTKLKLQALTFMIIGKLERHYLNNMLDQAKKARNLATADLKTVTAMSDTDKKTFTDELDSNISLLENKMSAFNDNYQKAMEHGRRILRIPSNNFSILTANVRAAARKINTVGIVDAYRQMNDVFSNTKKSIDNMAEPIKRNVEISKAEQEEIRKSVYKALSGIDDKAMEKIAKDFDEEEKKIDKVIEKDPSSKKRERELDNFLNNTSQAKANSKLEKEELDKVLNGGRVENNAPKQLESRDLEQVLNEGNPIFPTTSSKQSIFEKNSELVMPEWLSNYKNDEKEEDDIFKTSPTILIDEDKITDDSLKDEDIAEYAHKLVGDKKELHEITTNDKLNRKDEELVPDVDDLKRQLEESAREREQKRIAKEEARKKYEEEKQAREKEEKELSDSKKEIEKMKEDINRKRKEQKVIDELNQKVKKALEYQRQIEENKRAALEEEQETKKYQETLKIEIESQTKVAEEREKVQSERAALQYQNTEVDSDLEEKKAMLQEFRKQLQSYNRTTDVIEIPIDFYSHTESADVKGNDFSTRTSVSKAGTTDVTDMEMNGFYVAPPIKESSESTFKKR